MSSTVCEIVGTFENGLVEEQSEDCRTTGNDKKYAYKRCDPPVGIPGLPASLIAEFLLMDIRLLLIEQYR